MVCDWDFVTMADYQSDMKESANRGASIIETQAREIRQLKIVICALVHSAEKPIHVSMDRFADLEPRAIIVEECPADHARIFRPVNPPVPG